MYYNQTIRFVKSFTPVRFQKIKLNLRKSQCLPHVLLFKLSVSVQSSTQIQSHSSCFVKTLAWIRQIIDGEIFALILENFTQAQNFLHKCHLCHYLCHLWQVPCSLQFHQPGRSRCEQLSQHRGLLLPTRGKEGARKSPRWQNKFCVISLMRFISERDSSLFGKN